MPSCLTLLLFMFCNTVDLIFVVVKYYYIIRRDENKFDENLNITSHWIHMYVHNMCVQKSPY